MSGPGVSTIAVGDVVHPALAHRRAGADQRLRRRLRGSQPDPPRPRRSRESVGLPGTIAHGMLELGHPRRGDLGLGGRERQPPQPLVPLQQAAARRRHDHLYRNCRRRGRGRRSRYSGGGRVLGPRRSSVDQRPGDCPALTLRDKHMGVDFSLTREQEEIRELAHEFAEKEMRPVAERYDETRGDPLGGDAQGARARSRRHRQLPRAVRRRRDRLRDQPHPRRGALLGRRRHRGRDRRDRALRRRDHRHGHRGAEAEVHRHVHRPQGAEDRRHGAHRAQQRLGLAGAGDDRDESRRRLRAQRHQAVLHQRRHRRRPGGFRHHRQVARAGRHRRVRHREGNARACARGARSASSACARRTPRRSSSRTASFPRSSVSATTRTARRPDPEPSGR